VPLIAWVWCLDEFGFERELTILIFSRESKMSSPPVTGSESSSSSVGHQQVTFDLRAFSKVILHVTKYPQNPVNGVLLREKKKASESGSRKFVIQDAIPILHMCKYTTPMMEFALTQIEQYCKGSDLEVVGYYQANESLKDNQPDIVALRVSEKLAESNPNLVVVMINNDQLNSNLECAPFTLFQVSEGKLRPKEAKINLLPDEDGALSTVSALIQAKSYRHLIDFDNHLDDIGLNYWINPKVNEEIEQLSS